MPIEPPKQEEPERIEAHIATPGNDPVVAEFHSPYNDDGTIDWSRTENYAAHSPQIQAFIGAHPSTKEYVEQELELYSSVEIWERAFNKTPDKVAVRTKDAAMTYHQLDQQTSAFGGKLQQLHSSQFKAGDRVLLMLPTSIESLVCKLGTQRAGCVPAIPVISQTPQAFKAQLEDCILNTFPKVIVLPDDPELKKVALATIKEMQTAKYEKSRVDAAKEQNFHPKDIQLIFVEMGAQKPSHYKLTQSAVNAVSDIKCHSYKQFINSGAKVTPIPTTIATLDQPSEILFTSGTTGKSGKPVVYTHRNCVTNAHQYAAHMRREYGHVFNKQTPTKVFFGLPTAHAYGNMILTQGAPVLRSEVTILHSPADPAELQATIGSQTYDVLFSVDRQLEGVIQAFGTFFTDTYQGKTVLVVNGGSAAKQSTIESTKEAFGEGCTFISGYGMTELTVLSHLQDPKTGRYNSVYGDHHGVVAGGNTLQNGFDPRTAFVTKVQEGDKVEGIMYVTGNTAKEYLYNPEETAKTFITDIDGRVWVNTGDIVEVHSDQTFDITGRQKEIMIKGGKNYSPPALASAAMGCEFVQSAVFFPIPKDFTNQGGDDHFVMIVIKKPNQDYNFNELCQHMISKGAERAELPQEGLVFVSENPKCIPTTKTAKPQIVLLKNKVMEQIKTNYQGCTNPSHGQILEATEQVTLDLAQQQA
ncbi:class I adenylate-forming enzyme family protein [Parashewanella tropica]|uniref:class I adenylate-forming enzyme family protein n=1 Tax=Parashewanella tropica TaxID=2547970 RepID=UPI0010596696|nr:class I adenylate-forming enzyme family protein [Parashewanella tropica]